MNKMTIHIQCSLLCEYDVICVIDLVANWKLGQDKMRLSSHCILRLDKTAKKLNMFRFKIFSLDVLRVQFTPLMPTRQKTRQCSLVGVSGVN